MKKIFYIYCVIAFTAIGNINAQVDKLATVDKDYNNFSFKESSEELEKLIKKGEKSKQIYDKLANSYYYIGDMKNAAKWYNASLQEFNSTDREIMFLYSLSLKRSGNVLESDKVMKEFSFNYPSDSRSIKFAKAGDYMSDINEASKEMKMPPIDHNSKYSDFGTAFYKDGIVIASSQGGGREYNWTQQPFLDLFYADNVSGKLVKLSSKVNSKLHESTPVFTKDGQTMYFTRNNYLKGKPGKNQNDVTLLKIYRARLVDGKWDDIESLPFNSDEYNVSHPTLNKEENKMYFASDMPGTLGDSDIFVVDINLDDSFGKPENLGPIINTAGKESFPFITEQNVLYFSSNGLPGLGGLDIYEFDLKLKNAVVRNMGRPINSIADDFCFIVSESKNIGYLSTNREGGKGDDDIYSFRAQDICSQTIMGTVVDKETKKPVPSAFVQIRNNKGELIAATNSDEQGTFSFLMACADETFKTETTKIEYDDNNSELVTTTKDGEVKIEIELTKSLVVLPEVKAKVDESVDLTKLLNLEPLYFELNKSNITPQAEEQLAKVINYMNEYKRLKVDVRSHTDSRGSDAYNLALSERRAKSTLDYLVAKGIKASRLTGRGYGETKLINNCANNVNCSEEEHALNRRSEFIVVK